MPLIPQFTLTKSKCLPFRYPDLAKKIPIRLPGGVTLAAGTVMGLVTTGAAARDEVQTITITGTPTGGTFTITFGSFGTTAAIAYNASAATVQTACEAILGVGNVTAAGGALPGTAVTLTFKKDLGSRDLPLVTATSALTGGTSPAVTPTETTKGYPGPTGNAAAYDDSASDGTQVAKGLLVSAVQTDFGGYIKDQFGSTGNLTAEMWVAGDFMTTDQDGTLLLTGLDANGVTDLGKMVEGTAYTSKGGILSIR